jgi:hypothetical protein
MNKSFLLPSTIILLFILIADFAWAGAGVYRIPNDQPCTYIPTIFDGRDQCYSTYFDSDANPSCCCFVGFTAIGDVCEVGSRTTNFDVGCSIGVSYAGCHPYFKNVFSDGDPCALVGNWYGLDNALWDPPGTSAVWDKSEGKCITCTGRLEERVWGDANGVYGDGGREGTEVCEAACGAAKECDEVSPNSCSDNYEGYCDGSCNFGCSQSCGSECDSDSDCISAHGPGWTCDDSCNCVSACTSGICDGICPSGCEGNPADPDCVCNSGNKCCGNGCTSSNDDECPYRYLEIGVRGNGRMFVYGDGNLKGIVSSAGSKQFKYYNGEYGEFIAVPNSGATYRYHYYTLPSSATYVGSYGCGHGICGYGWDTSNYIRSGAVFGAEFQGGCTPSWGSWINQGCEAYCGSVEGYCPNGKRCERKSDGCGNYEYRCVADCNCNHCANGFKDCDEYGVDCGGSDCSECVCGVTWGIDYTTEDCSTEYWASSHYEKDPYCFESYETTECDDYCIRNFGEGSTGSLEMIYESDSCFYYCYGSSTFTYCYDCVCTVSKEEDPCGTTDCPADCCAGRFLYNYTDDFTRACSSESCQPSSNDCIPTSHDCSKGDNEDGDEIPCNCDCNGYDVVESEANGNCDDGKDNDCDGLIDEDDPDCLECTPGESYSQTCNYCSASDDWCTGGSQTITCDSSGHWGPPSSCTGGTCLCTVGECGVTECQVCGDGTLEGTEECELPLTSNNENCFQESIRCDYSSRTYCSRDGFGDCDSNCLCAPDSWSCGLADDTDYCDNCDAHCGDGFCNCGETSLDCPSDNCAICTAEPIEVTVTVVMDEEKPISLSVYDIDPSPTVGSIIVEFDPIVIIPPNKNSLMTITVNPYTTSGTYIITVRGVGGDIAKTTSYKLEIP